MKILLTIAAALFVSSVFYLSLSAQSPYNSQRAPISFELLAAAIGASGPTGATNLVTLPSACTIASFENTTNVEIDALVGSAKKRVPSGQSRVYDLGAGNTRWAQGTVITAWGPSGKPSSGAFELFCQPY